MEHEHEHELVDMWVLQFEMLYKKPNHKQENFKVCNTCIKKPIYAPRGIFMKMGNVII
jgi:hypothetical protein